MADKKPKYVILSKEVSDPKVEWIELEQYEKDYEIIKMTTQRGRDINKQQLLHCVWLKLKGGKTSANRTT